jgi:hypothetical protein
MRPERIPSVRPSTNPPPATAATPGQVKPDGFGHIFKHASSSGFVVVGVAVGMGGSSVVVTVPPPPPVYER